MDRTPVQPIVVQEIEIQILGYQKNFTRSEMTFQKSEIATERKGCTKSPNYFGTSNLGWAATNSITCAVWTL